MYEQYENIIKIMNIISFFFLYYKYTQTIRFGIMRVRATLQKTVKRLDGRNRQLMTHA